MIVLHVLLGIFVLPAVVGYVVYGITDSGIATTVGVIGTIISFAIWHGKRQASNFRSHVEGGGLKPDYIASYGDNGVAIDLAAKKVFVGSIKKGKAVDFAEISSIEWENIGGKYPKYILKINTRNFDCPMLHVGFSDNKATREEAYAKLRAALGIG